MSYGKIGEGIAALFYISLLTIPLALWKVVDILVWLWYHLDISWVG